MNALDVATRSCSSVASSLSAPPYRQVPTTASDKSMPVASLLVWASVECRALPLCSCLKIAHRKSEGALPVYSRSSWSLAQLLRIGLIMGWRYTFLHQRNNGGFLSQSRLSLVAACSSDSSS